MRKKMYNFFKLKEKQINESICKNGKEKML